MNALPLLVMLAASGPAPAIIVDRGIVPLETCRIGAVGFRDVTLGWFSDYCGEIFVSHDGGRSWAPDKELERTFFGHEGSRSSTGVERVQRWLWLSSDIGLAFLYGQSKVFRTSDGGRSWVAFVLPSEDHSEWIYSADALGNHVWFCGSSGTVTRSDDQGRTWTRSERLFEKAAINPSDWCAGLSFVDSMNGWAAGWRSLWSSHDGGQTWTAMEPIVRPRPKDTGSEVRALFRESASVSWARLMTGTILRTDDSGVSWHAQDLGHEVVPIVVTRPDGRSFLGRRAQPNPGTSAAPLLDDDVVPVGTSGAISSSLDLYEAGVLMRSGPPVSPPSGQTVTLEGAASAGAASWGWSGTDIYRSEDQQRTWFHVGTTPAKVERLVALHAKRALARLADHRLVDSADEGKTWVAAETASRFDWYRATGEQEVPDEKHPLDCALSAPGTVTVKYGMQGCFGGSHNQISIEVASHAGSISGKGDVWNPHSKKMETRSDSHRVSRAEVEAAVRGIQAAAERVEVPSSCWSTNGVQVSVTWRCGDHDSTMEFFSSDCDREATSVTGASTSTGSAEPGSYARALGVSAAARDLAKRYLGWE